MKKETISGTIEAFDPLICEFLSSLVPQFWSHLSYYKVKRTLYSDYRVASREEAKEQNLIGYFCPLWKIGDVLINLPRIQKLRYGPPIKMAFIPEVQAIMEPLTQMVRPNMVREEIYDRVKYHQMVISSMLIKDPENAYQEIEKYLWTILKF